MSKLETALRLERVIPAPRHEVYRAWLDPDLLRRWLAPGGLAVSRAEVDARVGGHFRIWQSRGADAAGGFDCEVLDLSPDERIVFRWGFVGPERTRGPVYDSRLTILLQDAPAGGTLLTLIHERLDDLAAAMPEVAKKVRVGWELVLEKLAAEMAGGKHTPPSAG
jgi:uncharacterized protein YndB with AHSA1/START domain